MTERNIVGYARAWPVLLTGLLEPFLYLLSIGIGVGALVGDVDYAGRAVPYETFVASGMLATAAMNGAVFDTTFNFFIRLKYAKLYDAVLATPLEPTRRGQGRGHLGAAAGDLLLGGLPGDHGGIRADRVVVGGARAPGHRAHRCRVRVGRSGCLDLHAVVPRLRLREPRHHADVPVLGHVLPARPVPGRRSPTVVQVTPLYQGVALCRALTTGEVHVGLLGHVAYLAVLAAVGVVVAGRRIDSLLAHLEVRSRAPG